VKHSVRYMCWDDTAGTPTRRVGPPQGGGEEMHVQRG
jgi:hypothetical protein